MAILEKLSNIGKSVAQASGELVENSKINMDIKKKEKNAKTLKFELGKYIYQQFKSGQIIDDKVKIICSEIDMLYEQIAALEKEKEKEKKKTGSVSEEKAPAADAAENAQADDDIETLLEDMDLD